MDEHEPPGQRVPPLDLADRHLHEQDAEEHGGGATSAARTERRAPEEREQDGEEAIPKTAVARTWT